MSSSGIRQFAEPLTRKIGSVISAISVDDERPPRKAPEGSPLGDWLRSKQSRYAPFLSQGRVGNNWLVLAFGLIVAWLAITGIPRSSGRHHVRE